MSAAPDHLNFKQLESAALKAWKPVQAGFEKLKPAASEFGEALIALRAECKKRGQFMEWLRKNKIDENRAMYCLRLAQGKVKTASSGKADSGSFTITPDRDLEDGAPEALKRYAEANKLSIKGAACNLIEEALKSTKKLVAA
jgi:hypothetical protein